MKPRIPSALGAFVVLATLAGAFTAWAALPTVITGVTAAQRAGTKLVDISYVNPYMKPGANGWRLPTEAEWENAARGGATGHRFPWSDSDTIQHSRANYDSSANYAYDTSPTRGFHPAYALTSPLGSSPVGSFAPNDYGLYDMAGNVTDWCWDWYDPAYYVPGQTDPQGPVSGTGRVVRGGSLALEADDARCGSRNSMSPGSVTYDMGFRCVRGL